MNVVFIPYLDSSNSFSSIVVHNDLTFIVTKIKLSGTEVLFTLLVKWFVSFTYEEISFTTGWVWWSTNLEISDVWHSIEFITGLQGLFGYEVLV